MNAKLVILGALAMLAAPLAYAHNDAGTPKNYCEPGSDWAVHDYAPPATGSLLALNEDGNLGGDCDGITTVNPGTPCAGFDDPNDPLSFFVGLCDADINPPIADWDGHNEWALGGAWLLVNTGDGSPGTGGTLNCFGAEGHHTEFGTYAVDDLLLGAGASFTIAADTVGVPPSACGDFQTDESIDCIGSCPVPFGAGLDGAYIAFVTGTAGHVYEGSIDIDPLPVPTPGGPVVTSVGGAAPTWEAPGWNCVETIQWTTGESGSGTLELSCTPTFPTLGLCRQPIVSVYLYSGTGTITGSTGCTSLDASCTASLPLSGNPTVASCTDQSDQIGISGILCRIDVAAGQPYFAWAANCSNDP